MWFPFYSIPQKSYHTGTPKQNRPIINVLIVHAAVCMRLSVMRLNAGCEKGLYPLTAEVASGCHRVREVISTTSLDVFLKGVWVAGGPMLSGSQSIYACISTD